MLDICTCIISYIIFSDLVPGIYFQDTDTWDSCDMHYLTTWHSWTYHVILSRDLVFWWSCDYISWQLLVQDISYYCTWSIFSIIHVIITTFSPRYCQTYYACVLLIVITFCPTYCYYIFIFSLLSLFSFVYSCWSASDGPFYYFSVFRSESWHRELFVDHILVQLFSGEFNFLSWLVLFRYSGWYCLWFSFSYMWFYPCA